MPVPYEHTHTYRYSSTRARLLLIGHSTDYQNKIKICKSIKISFYFFSDKDNVSTDKVSESQIEPEIEKTEKEISLPTEFDEDPNLKNTVRDFNTKIFELFGEEIPSQNNTFKINEGVNNWWSDWMGKGLSAEKRKEVSKRYESNSDIVTEAPKVNLEIQRHLSDIAKKRDQHFLDTQNCVGSAILALASAVSMAVDDST